MAELENSEVWSGPRKPAVEFHAGAKLAATSEEFAAFRDAAGAWRREASRRLDALKARAARDDDAAALDRERAVDALGQCRAIKDVLRAVGLDLARGLDRAAARARDLEAGGGGAGLVAASLLDLSPPEVDDLLGSLRGDVGGGAPPAASEAAAALAAAVDDALDPLDERALRRAIEAVVEERLNHERTLGVALGARGGAHPAAGLPRRAPPPPPDDGPPSARSSLADDDILARLGLGDLRASLETDTDDDDRRGGVAAR